MATWAMRQRYAWIEARLSAGESFTREDLVRAFTITKQTVSATVREFQALNPGLMRYDGSRKAFVRSDAPVAGRSTKRELALIDALLAVRRELTIPAAEYVPAIPAAWAIIDAAIQSASPPQAGEAE